MQISGGYTDGPNGGSSEIVTDLMLGLVSIL